MKVDKEKLQKELDQTIHKLRQHHVRITEPRKAIIQFLIETTSHPTADDIYQHLLPTFKDISLATIYNNVKLLVAHGIIQELVYGDGAAHYDYSIQDHYHLMCRQCGKIVDLFYPILTDVEAFAAKETNFEIHNHRLEVYGLCPECQKIRNQQLKNE